VGPLATFTVGLALPLVANWLAADFQIRTRLAMGLVAGLGIVLSRWIVPALGGLRFGLAAAAVGLLVGWLW
jgi:hypothetical protein